MAITKIDGSMLKEMFSSGAALLVQNRENVDALNVFPVPDGDTGSNMSQTISAAIKEMNLKRSAAVADVADAVARGAPEATPALSSARSCAALPAAWPVMRRSIAPCSSRPSARRPLPPIRPL